MFFLFAAINRSWNAAGLYTSSVRSLGKFWIFDFAVVVVVYFILSRLLYLAYSANLGLLGMPHSGMGPLV